MTTFREIISGIELEELAAECRRLRLDDEETASVLAAHSRRPELLGLVVSLGGDARGFIRSRLEIRRGLRRTDA